MGARLYIESLLERFEGVGVDGSTTVDFSIPADLIMQWLHQCGNSSVLEDAWFIPDVCRRPSGIWQGLGRNGQENALIYGGVPTGEFAQDYNMIVGEDITIPPNRVFLVFLSPEFQVAKFRFEEADPVDPSLPLQYHNRFAKQLWLRHSQNS